MFFTCYALRHTRSLRGSLSSCALAGTCWKKQLCRYREPRYTGSCMSTRRRILRFYVAEQQVTFQRACDTARYLVQCRLILHDGVSLGEDRQVGEASSCDLLRRQPRPLCSDSGLQEDAEAVFSGRALRGEASFLLHSAIAFLRPEELSDVALERQCLGRCGFFLCSEATPAGRKSR